MTHVDVSLEGLSVMVGMPTTRDLHPLTVKSLIGTFTRCMKLSVPCDLGMVIGCGIITWARDEVLDIFLASEANRLFWVDSDMIWSPDQFIRMLALSKLVDVVSATYPAKKEPPTFYINSSPEMSMSEYGLMEIHGVGLGFTVMTREVALQLVEGKPVRRNQVTGKEMVEVFRTDRNNGDGRGEDMAFFADIRALGHKVWLDPSIDLGHIGTKVYTGSVMDAMGSI